jgi:CheY-like chemotaxis protein
MSDGDSAGREMLRILILEDDPRDAELAQRLLAREGVGFTAIVVDTRAAFEEQLATFSPDVILSDFSLPAFSGGAALEIAQEQCPQIPFIIMSGVLGDESAVELIKQGATDYVLKDRPARLPSVIPSPSPRPGSGRNWPGSKLSCAGGSAWRASADWPLALPTNSIARSAPCLNQPRPSAVKQRTGQDEAATVMTGMVSAGTPSKSSMRVTGPSS